MSKRLTLIFAATVFQLQVAPLKWPMDIINSPTGPVRVADVTFDRGDSRQDVLVTVENVSGKRIRTIEYNVVPEDYCAGSQKWIYPVIAYGNPKTTGSRTNPPELPIAPGKIVIFRIPALTYSGILQRQRTAKCAIDAKPDFTILTVAFCDGTGWEGFADGPDHAFWNGRPWLPPDRTACSPEP